MAHSTSHTEEANAPWLDSNYWPEEQSATGVPEHWAHQAQPPTAPPKPQRSITELGFHGLDRRLIVSASTKGHLEETIQAARLKGWEVIELYEGFDPATGWPTVWMHKPVIDFPDPATTQAQSEPQREQH